MCLLLIVVTKVPKIFLASFFQFQLCNASSIKVTTLMKSFVTAALICKVRPNYSLKARENSFRKQHFTKDKP